MSRTCRYFGQDSVICRGFTERAAITMLLAEGFANEQHVHEITPEHILRGMASVEVGVGRTALQAMGVHLPRLMPEILELLPERPRRPGPTREELRNPAPDLIAKYYPEPELGPGARECLEEARKAATEWGHNYVGTEHLLLGLLRQESAAAAFLRQRGVTPERATEEVLKVLGAE